MNLRLVKIVNRDDICYFHLFYIGEDFTPFAIIENRKGETEFVYASWVTFVDEPSRALGSLNEVKKC